MTGLLRTSQKRWIWNEATLYCATLRSEVEYENGGGGVKGLR